VRRNNNNNKLLGYTVIVATAGIAAEHGSFNRIRQMDPHVPLI